MNNKDYYEGDLDGFEIWLANLDTDEINTELKKKTNMIKMKELLSLTEDIDKDIKRNIDEIGELDHKIDELQKKLKPLRKQYGELVDNVLPMLNKLGKEQYKTRNYIFKIIRKGYERQSFQYKEGFNRALDKVNKNVRRILEQVLDDTKKMVKISPSFQVKPVEIRESSFTDWIKKYTRKVVRKIIPYMKIIVKTNNDLRKRIYW
jgi:septal ring factor EnvC (AmiA/AmiB activator)